MIQNSHADHVILREIVFRRSRKTFSSSRYKKNTHRNVLRPTMSEFLLPPCMAICLRPLSWSIVIFGLSLGVQTARSGAVALQAECEIRETSSRMLYLEHFKRFADSEHQTHDELSISCSRVRGTALTLPAAHTLFFCLRRVSKEKPFPDSLALFRFQKFASPAPQFPASLNLRIQSLQQLPLQRCKCLRLFAPSLRNSKSFFTCS